MKDNLFYVNKSIKSCFKKDAANGDTEPVLSKRRDEYMEMTRLWITEPGKRNAINRRGYQRLANNHC